MPTFYLWLDMRMFASSVHIFPCFVLCSCRDASLFGERLTLVRPRLSRLSNFACFGVVRGQRDAVVVDDDENSVVIEFTPTIPHCRFECATRATAVLG